jgi:hypothetical protein
VSYSESLLEESLMTTNGPYPGPPSQPWSGGGSDEPYTEPADPWGEHPTASAPGTGPWGAHPPPVSPTAPTSPEFPNPYAPASNTAPPSWGQPVPVQKRRNTPIVALVVVLGLLICGGLGTTAWLLSRQEDPLGRGTTTTSAKPSAPATAQVAAPQPRSSEDARFVAKGQCVRNEGTETNPLMKIVPCTTGTFEVLKRVDGRTTGEPDAQNKCAKVEGYTSWFFYDSELDSLDFVLCLKKR